jgi:hypothetical protein
MIVYNVLRRWFVEKAPAETYRKAEGLKPSATAKVTVGGRDDLAALLNALCEPQDAASAEQTVVRQEVLDRAYVAPRATLEEIPSFLLRGSDDKEHQEELRRREGSAGDIFG